MTIPELAQRLPPEWRDEFMQYISTGKASDAFMEYANDPLCEEVIDLAVDLVVGVLSEK